MAGTFPGVCNTQQIDLNGDPLVGALLYVYIGATTTLASLFQDIGLSIPASNPATADSSGRLPLLYVADGTYRVRLVDASGSVANGGFDYPQVPSIGASSSGGGGTSVDSTTIFQTGDPLWVPVSGVRTGWVRMNARTIGNPTSGASERANTDCQALFEYIWNTYPDSRCAVPGGRGSTATADWSANKQIALPDMRGRAPWGLDDMGNTAAGRLTNALFSVGNATTAYSVGGEPTHTLVLNEAPKGQYSYTDPGHTHTVSGVQLEGQTAGGGGYYNGVNTTRTTSSSYTGISLTDNAGGSYHNNMPPFALGTFFMKL